MARPTKLTEELIERFCEEVASGLPICYCCDLLEIHETTYEAWMNLAKEEESNGNFDSIYSLFSRSIKKSYAQHISDSRKRIQQGTPGWQGTAWWLERTNSFFMPKQKIEADDDGKVQVVIGGKVKDIKRDSNK